MFECKILAVVYSGSGGGVGGSSKGKGKGKDRQFVQHIVVYTRL